MDNSPIPPDLQITVGGVSAAVIGYAGNAYGSEVPPFNLQAAAYTIPRGAAGISADVTVSTASGSTTAPGAIRYLPAVQQFPLAGAALTQGIYDPTRDLYYFADASEIRVFSRAQGQWLTPIQVPAAPIGEAHRLWGIALSADGTKLAVSDVGTDVIYLIDPASPGAVQSFPVFTYVSGAPFTGQGVYTYPAGLAISNAGDIYFATSIVGGTGFDGVFKLNTTTGAITDYRVVGNNSDLTRPAITADNSKVFFNDDGQVFSVDTATGTVTNAVDEPGCCYGDYDLTLSADQTTLEATSYLYDTSLNGKSYLVLSDRDALNIGYVFGAKPSPDGALLFQPTTKGIDVFDGRLGTLRTRISLPFALSQNFDALVSDGKDNVLIAITGQTGSGIAIVDLGSLAEPTPLPYPGAQALVNPLSLQGNDAATGQPQPHRIPTILSEKHIPRTVIKHATSGVLLNKDGSPRPMGIMN